MNQPYDPNQQWGQQPQQPYGQPQQGSQPYGQPQTGAQPYGQPQTGSQQSWGQQPYGQPQQYGQPQTGAQPYGQPQQYGQPAYGAPQGAQPWGQPTQQKSGNGKMWAIIGGAVALLAAIGVTLWLVLGSGGRSVEDTIDGFFQAAKDNDKQAAMEYTCDNLDQSIKDSSGDSGISTYDVDYKIEGVKEDGDNATAPSTVTNQGETFQAEVKLTKNDDGDWEICDFTSSGSSTSTSGSGN